MDQVALAAAATAIAMNAGVVLSIIQERLLGKKLEGRPAFLVTVAASLAVGAIAVSQTGFTFTAHPGDLLGTALEILKVATAVVIAAKVAFEIFTRPVAQASPSI
jgi:hypothetical protein